VATILTLSSPITQFLSTFICVSKSLNDEERGGNCSCLNVASYGPGTLTSNTNCMCIMYGTAYQPLQQTLKED